jgi:hypothetical protein
MRAALLSHVVMWRTEMGRKRAGLSPAATVRYRAVARDWHARLADAAQLDPLGEMVIADACTGGAPSSASLALLCASQRSDGAVPPHPDAAAVTFDDLYHSTCVAALAGSLAARADSRQGHDASPSEQGPATWAEIRSELSRYRIVRESADEVVLAWSDVVARSFAVVVRRLTAAGADWLRVSTPIAYVQNLPLEPLLRRADGGVGAVVVEGDRCVLRQTLGLEQVSPAAIHTLIRVIAGQTAELQSLARLGRSGHAYSEVFSAYE